MTVTYQRRWSPGAMVDVAMVEAVVTMAGLTARVTGVTMIEAMVEMVRRRGDHGDAATTATAGWLAARDCYGLEMATGWGLLQRRDG